MSGSSNLIVISQVGRSTLHVQVSDRLDIGRECDGLLVTDERVSRQHLRLEVFGEQLMVTDLGSSNGTYLDGVRLRGPAPFEPNSTLTLGSISIEHFRDAGSFPV
ncbi:MAG: FHA domain-containing protein [Actinomycetia bacterium]|nr:FHA domain-containing protein [Actinomycetes bacterium]